MSELKKPSLFSFGRPTLNIAVWLAFAVWTPCFLYFSLHALLPEMISSFFMAVFTFWSVASERNDIYEIDVDGEHICQDTDQRTLVNHVSGSGGVRDRDVKLVERAYDPRSGVDDHFHWRFEV